MLSVNTSEEYQKSLFTENKRKYDRTKIGGVVTILDRDYLVHDWSASGFQVQSYDGGKLKQGDCIPVSFTVVFKGHGQFNVKSLAEIVWFSENNDSFGAKFLSLDQSQVQLLNSFVKERYLNQNLANYDDFQVLEAYGERIKNLERIKNKKEEADVQKKHNLIKAIIYINIGFFLVAAFFFVLINSLRTMTIKNAVIGQSVQNIISNSSGTIGTIYVEEGDYISRNNVLLEIYDHDLAKSYVREEVNDINSMIRSKMNNLDNLEAAEVTANLAERNKITDWNSIIRSKIDNIDELDEKIAIARFEQKQEEINLISNRLRKMLEESALNNTITIASNEIAAIRAQVEALETESEVAQATLERTQFLQEEGAISMQEVDEAKARLANIKGQLKTSKHQLSILNNKKDFLLSGKIFTDNQINPKLDRIDKQIAINKMRLANQNSKIDTLKNLQSKLLEDTEKLKAQNSPATLAVIRTLREKLLKDIEALKKYKNKLLLSGQLSIDANKQFFIAYESPVSGKVIKLEAKKGDKVRGGESLVIIEPNLRTKIVEAYLTQDQAAFIYKEMKVEVEIPHKNYTFPAQISKIDYRGGFRDATQGRYQYEGSINQPVYIEVQLLPDQDLETTMPGTPVILKIPRTGTIFSDFGN